MDGKPIRNEWLDLCAFGSKGKKTLSNVFEVNVAPLNEGERVRMEVCEVPSIARFPNVHPEAIKMKYEHLKRLWFSDLTEKDDLEIDMLTGADNIWHIQRGRIIRGEPGEPVAIETTLWWTISGQLHGPSDQRINVNLVIENGEIGEDHEMKRLWDFETLGINDTDDTDEELIDNIKFNGERYSVRLPWKVGYGRLSTNYQLCRSRLRDLNRRLDKDLALAKEYNKVIQEQLRERIIERVTEKNEPEDVHYLPHHPIIRKTAETMKLRVVFDASAKERKGANSLNDCLHVGPPLAPLMFDVLVRFREHKIVLVGDIRKLSCKSKSALKTQSEIT